MNESFWGVLIITLGIISISFIVFFQNLTNTEEHNYNLLRETTEAAMYDAIDMASYEATGEVRINREKFVENFVRRFAENAQLARNYKIEIYDVMETPPKVSLKVTSTTSGVVNNESVKIDSVNQLDAILETVG